MKAYTKIPRKLKKGMQGVDYFYDFENGNVFCFIEGRKTKWKNRYIRRISKKSKLIPTIWELNFNNQ